jgi:integrase
MRTLGERGCRIRLFERAKGQGFYRDVSIAGRPGKDRKSLGTTDRTEAEQRGKALLAMLRAGGASDAVPTRLTLGDLWERYRTTCAAFAARTPKLQADERSRVAVLLAHFGEACNVRDLCADDVAGYTTARRRGGIKVTPTWTTRAASRRTVVADLAVLNLMFNWAGTARVNSARLLDVNPLTGLARAKRDPHPRRPIATWDRYTATRTAMQRRASSTDDDLDRARWIKAELVLVLVEATGRRLSAVRHLRWEDVDWERKTIRWRAESDKRRKEWIVPTTDALISELRSFQKSLGAVGGWMCAEYGKEDVAPPRPMDRHALAVMLKRAEKDAALPKLEGGLWHPYRRKWATERKHLPTTDVAAAGGWQSIQTLATCYQQPTNDALLAVMSEERKVRDVAVVGARPREKRVQKRVHRPPALR